MSERVSEESLKVLLTSFDRDYSKTYHLPLLKFLALSVVKYGLLESCSDVFDVYEKMRDSLKDEDYRVAVSLLRHFLQITACPRAMELSDHCKKFDLITRAPSLPSYQLLLCLAYKIDRNDHYNRLFKSVDQRKFNKSKYDLRDAISAAELFQSMIFKGTLLPGNRDSLKQELVAILEGAKLEVELKYVQRYFNQQGILLI
jgi:hypothetical protein